MVVETNELTISPVTSTTSSVSSPPTSPDYGTFQGGRRVPPPIYSWPSSSNNSRSRSYQSLPICHTNSGRRSWLESLRRCCSAVGLELGWILFIAGIFLAGVPWYVGAIILLFCGVDERAKSGFIACLVGSILVVTGILCWLIRGTTTS